MHIEVENKYVWLVFILNSFFMGQQHFVLMYLYCLVICLAILCITEKACMECYSRNGSKNPKNCSTIISSTVFSTYRFQFNSFCFMTAR